MKTLNHKNQVVEINLKITGLIPDDAKKVLDIARIGFLNSRTRNEEPFCYYKEMKTILYGTGFIPGRDNYGVSIVKILKQDKELYEKAACWLKSLKKINAEYMPIEFKNVN